MKMEISQIYFYNKTNFKKEQIFECLFNKEKEGLL